MGVILNPRGAGGSGKTELTRRIMAIYGWRRGAERSQRIGPIYRERRKLPIGYRLVHPHGQRALVVIGHYERTCGGCDTIGRADGGIDEVFRLVDTYSLSGDDVLFEGLAVSRELKRSAVLASLHDLHVLRLDTAVDQCIRNLIMRRRARRSLRPSIARAAVAECKAIAEACDALRLRANVRHVDFDEAFSQARDLLGLSILCATGPSRQSPR